MERFRISLRNVATIVACLATTMAVSTAQAQSYYAEEWQNNKMIGKIWVSQESKTDYKSRGLTWGGLGFEYSKRDTALTITRMDSAKIFSLNPKTKTYTVFIDLSVALKGSKVSVADIINAQVGANALKNSNQTKELLGTDVIEGYECKHYRYTTASTLSTGQTETSTYENWIYEPLGVEMQRKDAGQYDHAVTLKNFKQGPQPASLFEIPKDYKNATKSVSGNPLEDLSKMQEMLKESNKGNADKIKKTQEDGKGKSESEQIMDLLNLMGGSTKKK
jgi:hypothetical protein